MRLLNAVLLSSDLAGTQSGLALLNRLPVQVLEAVAYVFCQNLQGMTPSMAHSIDYIGFPLVQKNRPNTSDWPPMTEGPHVYADINVR